MNELLEKEARRLVESGISVIPVKADGTKAPAVSWKDYQSRPATPGELRKWFHLGRYGLAAVAGEVSGNLEILDFDDPNSFGPWEAVVKEISEARSLEKLPIVLTPSGGFHVYFRCKSGVQGNQKLAWRTGREGRPEVMIETRGEGGYTILPESPPECHPLNEEYFLVQGDLAKIPTISAEERLLLFECARAFNEYTDAKKVISGPSGKTGNRPGDAFNVAADWCDVLEPHGWEKAGQRGEVTLWRRPGKKVGISATTNFAGRDLFYNFSTNGHPFEADTAYTKFSAYTLLNHNGDFSAAAADLAAKGYGQWSEPRDKSWLERSELPPMLPEVPALDLDLIPKSLRPWIQDIAERMQVPAEMVALPAMIGLSSVLGRQLGIHPKQKDDWLVIPNNYGAVVGGVATLKSPAQVAGLKPLQILVAEAADQYKPAVAQYLGIKEANGARIAGIKAKIKRIEEGKEQGDIDKLTRQLTDLKSSLLKPTEKRYKTNDPTVEKLAELQKENPNGLLLVRDELSGWLRSFEKWGREGDREFYLEAWNGNIQFDVDRIERGTIHVPALCLSIIGGIQPGKLESYVADAFDGGAGDDGLLQRFQLVVYPDMPPEWELVDRKPDSKAYGRAVKVFQALARLDRKKPGGKPSGASLRPSGQESTPALRFSPEAQDFFNGWLQELEKLLRSGDIDCPVFEAHLGKYRSTMPSLALIIHLCDWADDHCDWGPVSLEATVMAAQWCEFLKAHACRIYAPAIRPKLRAAHALVKKIQQGKIKHKQSVRDIKRSQWSLLRASEVVQSGLELLEELNWLQIEEVTAPGPGRSNVVVLLHPELRT